MASPLPVRGITGHLVWGVDGAVWACFETEPFAYPHRSVRDAREVHARTTAALLGFPSHSLVLSIAHMLSRDELERRIRVDIDSELAPGWAGMARRTADRLATESVYERRWFVALQLPDTGGGRRIVDRVRAAAADVGSKFGAPQPEVGHGRLAVAMGQAGSLADQLGQHLRLRPLDGGQVCWLYERAVLRGLFDPPLPDGGIGDRPSVVRLDRDTVYFEGGDRNGGERLSHWRYLTVEHPDHGTGHQAFSCLAETPAAWTFPYGSGEWLWHLDDQLPFPVDWAVRIERVDNQTARRRAMDVQRELLGSEDFDGLICRAVVAAARYLRPEPCEDLKLG